MDTHNSKEQISRTVS